MENISRQSGDDYIPRVVDSLATELLLLDDATPVSLERVERHLLELSERFQVLALLDETGQAVSISRAIEELLEQARLWSKGSPEKRGSATARIRDGVTILRENLLAYHAVLAGPPPTPSQESASPAGGGIPPLVDAEMFMDFFAESQEHLSQAEAMLLKLEEDERDAAAVNELFRSMHSIKGMAGFLALEAIGELTHAMETLLDVLRNGRAPDRAVVSTLLEARDLVKLLVEREAARHEGRTPSPVPDRRLGEMKARLSSETARMRSGGTSIGPRPAPPPAIEERAEGPASSDARPDAIKVKLDRIESLVNMIGELVITHHQIQQRIAETSTDQHLLKTSNQMNRIVSDLQELTLNLRMVPMRGAFRKLVRLVRDFSIKHGKKVEAVVTGESTELDRNVIEELSDPLVHLVRNSLDHGLETPEERMRAGKSEQGTIRLDASHKSGMVVIEIRDDGRGFDRERIRRKGIERGLLSAAETHTDSQIYKCVFEPGFSTAETVTDVSGRGVGMDVVKRNIERLRGTIEIASEKGAGSTVRIMIPLTLAIIDGMVIRVGEDRFVVPTLSILESFRPRREQMSTVAGKGELLLVREELLPLVRLHRLFDIVPRHPDPCEGLVMMIQSSVRRFLLQIDELVGQQQVVIKSLGKVFDGCQGVSGGAIMGDGRVGLILDPERLAEISG